LTGRTPIDEEKHPHMKISFYISVATAALSLVLAVIVLAIGYGNQGLQTQIQAQQREIQKQQGELQKQQDQINTAQQINGKVGTELLRDMGLVSLKNEKMKLLLGKHGYSVQQSTPAPGAATPAPATPAPAAFTPPALR
jgi:uncharacterized protein HemX